ncbi:DUF4339 domain-containing protein [Flavobacterium sp.]|uniref:DUF4339 domain-containing protein n=1 Tax=Flavobacterium sp. TaxID=239 RepID=UPI0025D4F249|nr:DUF4339 domain-containing protein [Flavobacterium sp.]
MRKYFYTDGVTKFGPFSKEELKEQQISRSTKIWYFGIENWTELSLISDLDDLTSVIPPDLSKPTPLLNNNIKSNKFDFKKSISSLVINLKTHQKKKWLVGISVSIILSLIILGMFRKQSEEKLYEDIAANSYLTDEKFEIYIDKFYRDLEFYGIYPKKPSTIIIKFSKLDQLDNTTHIHAISFGRNDDDRIEIYINPSSWKQFTKSMRYYLMYHELSHDILNVDDLDRKTSNEGRLMYPEISSYERKNMDDFIESYHTLFEEESSKWKQ